MAQMSQKKENDTGSTKGSKCDCDWVKHKPVPYYIDYTKQSEESDAFKNTRKLFDEHHSIILRLKQEDKPKKNVITHGQPAVVTFAMSTDPQPNDNETPGQQYKIIDKLKLDHLDDETPEGVTGKLCTFHEPQFGFYQYLNKILTKIGGDKKEISVAFEKTYQHIISNMMNSIYQQNSEYKLMTKLMTLQLREEQNEQKDDKEDIKAEDTAWSYKKDAKFNMKLNFEYDEWMKDHSFYANSIKNELSAILQISPSLIKIDDNIKKGSVIIDFWVLNVWIPLYVEHLQSDPMTIPHNMRPQDQIEVKYKDNWYAATIMDIRNFVTQEGINFKLHYNKVRGSRAFTFNNTEWFYSKVQSERLRLPNKIYITFTAAGSRINSTFIPPPLAQIEQISDVHCGHHIFVKRKGMWHRCEVIEIRNLFEGTMINVTYLDYIFLDNDEWLKLWNQQHLARICLNDMRPYI